jgi:hypothetical protein
MKWLINYKEGLFEKIDESSLHQITNSLSSYKGHQIFFAVGKEVIKTQNCFSWGGCVLLVNALENTYYSDYAM